ncbi:DUF6795 domain-containing protein [Limnobacter litoralis]|uniref:DUF6795 domain-containing protein n=1 Tax=Limnobacter litoralis TaxID=481366 RepID=A0ABQ5YT61_9BURK|nr:DUF6795 domain-containing protein [Limnobacter litoralis]GLR25622.1 hypothetical protein GCM10007875_07100 [Limnobacter litoralis]
MRARYLVPVVLLAAISHHPAAEAFMFFKENYYCSPVQGRIVLNGKPLGGITIKRRILNNGLPGGQLRDQTETDKNGNFSLPSVKNRTFLQPDLFASATLIDQRLELVYEGKAVLIWDQTKSDFDPSSDANTPNGLISLKCELAHIEETTIPGVMPFVKCSPE